MKIFRRRKQFLERKFALRVSLFSFSLAQVYLLDFLGWQIFLCLREAALEAMARSLPRRTTFPERRKTFMEIFDHLTDFMKTV